jgi:phosphohistidine phosphatase
VRLYLVRHGDALERGGAVATDAERPLSAQGEADVRRAGLLLARVDPAVGLVLTSPAQRASETARLIAEALPSRPDVRASDRLRPGTRVETMLEEILEPKQESIVAVGHQPDLGTLIAWLVADSGPLSISLPPGTMACIEMKPDAGAPGASLRWIAPPDLARRVPLD